MSGQRDPDDVSDLERRGALLSAVMGTVAAGIAVALLAVRYDGNGSVLIGFGLGVAVVGFAISFGMVGWTYVSDADGDSLYIYPSTVASASVLMMVSAANDAPRADPEALPLLLVGAATLIIVGFSLVFVSRLRTADGE